MEPFSLGRLLTRAGGTDSGSNLAELKLGLVFATIEPAGFVDRLALSVPCSVMTMMKPCGSCGKPVLRFSKELWTRSVRPQLRQLPQGKRITQVAPASYRPRRSHAAVQTRWATGNRAPNGGDAGYTSPR